MNKFEDLPEEPTIKEGAEAELEAELSAPEEAVPRAPVETGPTLDQEVAAERDAVALEELRQELSTTLNPAEEVAVLAKHEKRFPANEGLQNEGGQTRGPRRGFEQLTNFKSCDACRGKGRRWFVKCKVCRGSGRVVANSTSKTFFG